MKQMGGLEMVIFDLYAIIILFLFIQIFLLNFWAKEHATLMQVMQHCLVEIKKKIP